MFFRVKSDSVRGGLSALGLWIGACASEALPAPPMQTAPQASAGTTAASAAGRSAIAGAATTPTVTSPIGAQAGGSAVIPVVTPMGVAGMTARPPTVIAQAGAPAAPPAPAAGSGEAPPTTPPTMGVPVGTGTTCLKPGNGMYTNPGPYKVAMKEVDLGMIDPMQHTGKFTIYYPNPLEASCLHPIVAWGNGTGVQGSGTYAFLNSNAASWGLVVAEAQEDNTGSGKFHKAGIDYLLKENDDASSPFYKKLSTRAGVSGHSQGGFGASMGSAHPNVVTAAIEGASMNASAKVSVLVLTGTGDIVMNPESLVTNARGPMFVGNLEGGDHVTTETVAGSISGDKGTLQFTRLYAGWLRCMLADDPVACKMFTGGAPGNCGICKDPGWHSLTSKNL